MLVLNVGGGASRDLPSVYKGWDQHVLDIDPAVSPDVLCDVKDMRAKVKAQTYDAVFCSHNLEHVYAHEVPQVLAGFRHALKASGFAQIIVPDLNALLQAMRGRDVMDAWYGASGCQISFHDVLYGWSREMGRGNLYYAHKCGFTSKSLSAALRKAGFAKVMTAEDGYNVHAFAFMGKPTAATLKRLGL